MNRYDIVNSEDGSQYSYGASEPMPNQPAWGADPQITVTDITYDYALAECHAARAREYPAIGDQLDAIYKRDHLDDPTQWQAIAAQIDAVKAKYPKPVPPNAAT